MYNTTTNTTNLDLFAVQHEYCPLIGYDPLKQCCLLGLVLIGVECIAARMYSCKFPDSSGSVANLLKTVKHCLTTTIPIAKYLGIVIGADAHLRSWDAPIAKFKQSVSNISYRFI